jgi:predicted nuclease with TOPRIM domain
MAIEAVALSISEVHPLNDLSQSLETIMYDVKTAYETLTSEIDELESEKQSLATTRSELKGERETLAKGLIQLKNDERLLTEQQDKLLERCQGLEAAVGSVGT